jgi:predicted RNA-binding Zn-ribbon protein involved in translation (DUF1610 family)
MTLQPIRKQDTEGEQAVFVTKSGGHSPLHALDFTGREVPLYVEKQARDPQTGELPTEEPQFFCPSCGNHFLENRGISGPNAETTYHCPGCSTSWNRSQQMLRGIGLVMQ